MYVNKNNVARGSNGVDDESICNRIIIYARVFMSRYIFIRIDVDVNLVNARRGTYTLYVDDIPMCSIIITYSSEAVVRCIVERRAYTITQ